MRLERLFLYGLLAYDVGIFLALSYYVVVGEIDVFNYGVISTLAFGLGILLCIELEREGDTGEEV
jgi:hypothetical protein